MSSNRLTTLTSQASVTPSTWSNLARLQEEAATPADNPAFETPVPTTTTKGVTPGHALYDAPLPESQSETLGRSHSPRTPTAKGVAWTESQTKSKSLSAKNRRTRQRNKTSNRGRGRKPARGRGRGRSITRSAANTAEESGYETLEGTSHTRTEGTRSGTPIPSEQNYIEIDGSFFSRDQLFEDIQDVVGEEIEDLSTQQLEEAVRWVREDKEAALGSKRQLSSIVFLPATPIAVGGGSHLDYSNMNDSLPGPAKRPLGPSKAHTAKRQRLDKDASNTDTVPSSEDEQIKGIFFGSVPKPASVPPFCQRSESCQSHHSLVDNSQSLSQTRSPIGSQRQTPSLRYPPIRPITRTYSGPRSHASSQLNAPPSSHSLGGSLLSYGNRAVRGAGYESPVPMDTDDGPGYETDPQEPRVQSSPPSIANTLSQTGASSRPNTHTPLAGHHKRPSQQAPGLILSSRGGPGTRTQPTPGSRPSVLRPTSKRKQPTQSNAGSQPNIHLQFRAKRPQYIQSTNATGTTSSKHRKPRSRNGSSRQDRTIDERQEGLDHNHQQTYKEARGTRNDPRTIVQSSPEPEEELDEALPDDEEIRQSVSALTADRYLNGQKRKLLMSNTSAGIQRQILSLAKFHLWAFALTQGVYQTRAVFLRWARVIHKETWRLELPLVPHREPTEDQLSVMVGGIPTYRGKCKDRARPLLEYVVGFRKPASRRKHVRGNLRLFDRIFPNSFHCLKYEPREGHYESEIMDRAIATILFHSTTSVGVVFYEYIHTLHVPVVAFVLSILQFCIEEFSNGYHCNLSLDSTDMLAKFRSHVKALEEFCDAAPGRWNTLRKRWLKYAMQYSGAARVAGRSHELPSQRSEFRPDTPTSDRVDEADDVNDFDDFDGFDGFDGIGEASEVIEYREDGRISARSKAKAPATYSDDEEGGETLDVGLVISH